MRLCGAQGYNNGVNILNSACRALYGNYAGVSARNINLDDMEAVMDSTKVAAYKANGCTIEFDGGSNWLPPVGYVEPELSISGQQYVNSNGEFLLHKSYPTLYAEEEGCAINPLPAYSGRRLKPSEERNGLIAKSNSFVSKDDPSVTSIRAIRTTP